MRNATRSFWFATLVCGMAYVSAAAQQRPAAKKPSRDTSERGAVETQPTAEVPADAASGRELDDEGSFAPQPVVGAVH